MTILKSTLNALCSLRYATMWFLLTAGMLLACVASARGQLTDNIDDMLNWCLDGKHHKSRPGPEDKLHRFCSPWRERACCTANISRALHTSSLHGFTYDHCPGRTMSAECRWYFQRDHCFYECSPNIGPWVTKVDMKIRNERFVDVPLCATHCTMWFEACKRDFTCTDNWTRNFRWKNGTNHCPAGAPCFTFEQVYQTADNFCEKVWDHSWKFTADTEPCMQLWFDPAQGNPNDAVARIGAERVVAAGAWSLPPPAAAWLVAAALAAAARP
ncbi:Folate receptor alpha [Amphibalanus amphitrite]|uniref:Folate receptor alpha n=1 Tax=Amphibalanus amphitrite TaxID=1232801 RepID=A0A6A4V0R3_AMPAM|nr:Folate receptor alpha [Amphibalanus amphitrite]